MPSKHAATNVPATRADTDMASKVGAAILGFLGGVPRSNERKRRTPAEAARKAANRAAAKAAAAAGTLALPPGPLGWLTILPEIERRGLIRRVPGQARSITLAVPPESLPPLQRVQPIPRQR